MKLRFPLLAATLSVAAVATASGVQDLATAKSQSRSTGKPVLIDFSSPT